MSSPSTSASVTGHYRTYKTNLLNLVENKLDCQHFGSAGPSTRVRSISSEYFSTRICDLLESLLPKKHILLCSPYLFFLMVNDEQTHILCTSLLVSGPTSSFFPVLFLGTSVASRSNLLILPFPVFPSASVCASISPLSLCDRVSLSCFLVLCVSVSVVSSLSLSVSVRLRFSASRMSETAWLRARELESGLSETPVTHSERW